MADAIPSSRIRLPQVAPKQFAAMLRLDRSIELPGKLGELVKVRASQINGCAFCIDMHWKDARAGGEREERLYSLDAWRESPLYDERERAAIALQAMTFVSHDHVPDEVWEEARAVLEPEELGQLVFAIAAINAWNRLMIASRTEPGHYEPARAAELDAAAA